MARCPKCKGAGGKALFTSVEKCAVCGGTGRVSDDPVLVKGSTDETEPGDGTMLATGTSSSHVLHTGGTLTSTGSTSQMVFTGMSNSHTVTGSSTSTLTIGNMSSPGTLSLVGDETEIYMGSGGSHPAKLPNWPRGSLYVHDDGSGAGLWFKTEEGWEPVRVGADADSDPATLPQETALLRWSVEHIRPLHEAQQRAQQRARDGMEPEETDDSSLEWLCGWVPVIAPLCLQTVADVMSLVEQEGHETHAFVTSPRDFADVRKWGDTARMRWEGGRVWIFGVEVLHSPEVPVGHFMAVSRDGHAAVGGITR